MDEVTVSVIMPVYNAEKYLPMALDSLLEQTLNNFEVICVDDGSADDSLKILEEYKRKFPSFVIIRQKNSYAGVARNNGMKVAKGKYFSFLDSDDYFQPTMLEEAYCCAEKEKADVVIFGGRYFSDIIENAHSAPLIKEQYLNSETIVSKETRSQYQFNLTTPAPWNKLFSKKLIEDNHLQFQTCKRANDVYFVELALVYAKRIAILRKDLICYRTGNINSLQGTNSETPMLFLRAFSDIQKKLREDGIYDRFAVSFKNLVLSNCIYNLNSLNSASAFIELYSALKKSILKVFELHDLKEEDCFESYLFKKLQCIMNCDAEEYLMKQYKDAAAKSMKMQFIFPFGRIKTDSKIVLYAAGNVGKIFYEQLKKTAYCEIMAWIDKKAQEMADDRISLLQDADFEQCDYVVIAVEDERVAKNIAIELEKSFGVDRKKIVWEHPRMEV